ncbi:hypothetical protein D3C81_1227760 [compost metagenome]
MCTKRTQLLIEAPDVCFGHYRLGHLSCLGGNRPRAGECLPGIIRLGFLQPLNLCSDSHCLLGNPLACLKPQSFLVRLYPIELHCIRFVLGGLIVKARLVIRKRSDCFGLRGNWLRCMDSFMGMQCGPGL